MKRRDVLKTGFIVLLSPTTMANAFELNVKSPELALMRSYVDEYVNRFYSGCSQVIKVPQTAPERLTNALYKNGFNGFVAQLSSMALQDFHAGNVTVIDGWILPKIELEILSFHQHG